MTIRKFAAVSVAAALLLGTTGCTFMSPVASRIDYAPADGSQVVLDKIKVRNFVYLTNGTNSALTGSVINTGLDSTTFSIQYLDAKVEETKTVTFSLGAGQKLDLGYNGGKALAIDLGGKAGDIVRINVSENNGEAVELRIPVLDGTFDYYRDVIAGLDSVEPSTK